MRREIDSLKQALLNARATKEWVAHPSGTFYYRATCRAAQELPDRVFFATEAEARTTGRRASEVLGCQ
jgi:hypothetical protein